MSLREQAAFLAFVYGLPSVALYSVLHELVLAPATGPRRRRPELFRAGRVSFGLVGPPAPAWAGASRSCVWLDLREGPLLLTAPSDAGRHPSSPTLVDLYADVVDPAPTGSQSYLLAGPSWDPLLPAGVSAVLRCRTDLCLGVGMAAPGDDADRVPSRLGSDPAGPVDQAAAPPALPRPVPPVDVWRPPGVGFLTVLDWMLPLMPTLPGEEELRADLELAGVSCGPEALVEALAEDRHDGELTQGLRAGFESVRHRAAHGPQDAPSPAARGHLDRAARVLGSLVDAPATTCCGTGPGGR